MQKQGYIESEIRTEQEDLRQRLIERTNQYARSIKHHPYKNLGNEIAFTQIKYCPSYKMVVQTQFDVRNLSFRETPLQNQNVPKRVFSTLESVDAWSYQMLQPTEFINDAQQMIIEGSQHVETCHKCNGAKKIECPSCSGRKRVLCSHCRGEKKARCTNCGGRGDERCSTCGGTGKEKMRRNCPDCLGRGVIYPHTTAASMHMKVQSRSCTNPGCSGGKITMTQSCSSCSGSGERTCSSCGGSGQTVCSTCSGSGYITCSRCSGRGEITCTVCAGEGQLLHYIQLNQSIESDCDSTYSHHSRTVIYPEYREKADSLEGNLIYTDTHSQLAQENLPHDFEPMANWLKKTWEQTSNRQSSNRKIVLQQIDIYEIPVYIVNYSFRGRKYSMLFFGNDLEIIADKSPVYDIAVEYTRKSEDAYARKDFSSAKKYAEMAKDMGLYNNTQRISSISNKVDRRLNLGYKWGISAAFTLLMLAGGAVMFQYYSQVNYVFNFANRINFPDNFLYETHVWVMLILFISGSILTKDFVMDWAVQSFGKFFPSIWQRVLVGGALSVVGMALWAVLLAGINATGITQIVTFGFWLIIKILVLLLKILLLILAVIVGIFSKIF